MYCQKDLYPIRGGCKKKLRDKVCVCVCGVCVCWVGGGGGGIENEFYPLGVVGWKAGKQFYRLNRGMTE